MPRPRERGRLKRAPRCWPPWQPAAVLAGRLAVAAAAIVGGTGGVFGAAFHAWNRRPHNAPRFAWRPGTAKVSRASFARRNAAASLLAHRISAAGPPACRSGGCGFDSRRPRCRPTKRGKMGSFLPGNRQERSGISPRKKRPDRTRFRVRIRRCPEGPRVDSPVRTPGGHPRGNFNRQRKPGELTTDN